MAEEKKAVWQIRNVKAKFESCWKFAVGRVVGSGSGDSKEFMQGNYQKKKKKVTA